MPVQERIEAIRGEREAVRRNKEKAAIQSAKVVVRGVTISTLCKHVHSRTSIAFVVHLLPYEEVYTRYSVRRHPWPYEEVHTGDSVRRHPFSYKEVHI